MPLLHLILVAAIQGITEFLPVSSSGHLVLLPRLSGLPDQGLAIDVAVHVGTLLAVIVYFRAEAAQVASGIPRLLRGRADTPGARLALLLLASAVPAMIAGLALKLSGADTHLRSIAVVGWATLVFGIVLYLADRIGGSHREVERDWTLRHAVAIGLWQVLALIPGTSRSGIAITGARLLGYSRREAARLSMLMSVPVILASGALLSAEAIREADAQTLRDGAVAALFAFAAALAALAAMMRLLRTVSFTPYVIYRIALGAILLAIAYS